MEWKKATAEVGAILDGAMRDFAHERRVMFGAPCYFLNGNMYAGVYGDSVFVRVSPADRQEALASGEGAAVLEPVPRRVMKDYVMVPPSALTDAESLRSWLGRAFTYVSTVPPKEPAPRRARKRS